MYVPKVTVGMPAYNRAGVLGGTIQQVLDQTFRDFEFIIYNDGSTDHTAEVIRSFQDERIIFIDQPNLGPPHPLNAIYKQARGEYIIILHDHDFFHPELLEKSVVALEKYPEAGFVLQGSAWIDEDGVSNYREMLHDLPKTNHGRVFGERIIENKKSFSSIFHACSMVRRFALETSGMYYNPEFELYADTDLWLRLLISYDFIYLSEVLLKFRTRETQGHFLNNRQFEILNWQKNINIANTISYFGVDAIKVNYVQKKIQNNYNYAQIHLFIQSIAMQNNDLYIKGICELNKNTTQPLFFKAMINIITFPAIKHLLWHTLPWMNKFRKKFNRQLI